MSNKEFGDFLVVIKIFCVITTQLSICYKIFIMIALIILGTLVLTAMMILFFAKSFYELTFWFSPRVFFCLFERMKNPKWEMKSNFFKIDSTNKLKSMDSKNGFYTKLINKTWKEVTYKCDNLTLLIVPWTLMSSWGSLMAEVLVLNLKMMPVNNFWSQLIAITLKCSEDCHVCPL